MRENFAASIPKREASTSVCMQIIVNNLFINGLYVGHVFLRTYQFITHVNFVRRGKGAIHQSTL